MATEWNEDGEQIRFDPPLYPPFDENPECRCYPNGIAATICMTGHLTECHYPKTCDLAQCAHYQRAGR